jgi:hypothetical protein
MPNLPIHKRFPFRLIRRRRLTVVLVLIARRIHYRAFDLFKGTGVLFHETYNQLYPSSAAKLTKLLRHKDLLGFHDIRVGNDPDKRLIKFCTNLLSTLLSNASEEFVLFRPLLQKFETSKMDQEEFATAKKKILAGMEPIEAMVRDPFPQHVQTLSLPPEELENLDSSEPF